MPPFQSLSLSARALSEMGPKPLMLYGCYRLGLYSGYLRWKLSKSLKGPAPETRLEPFLSLPTPGAVAAVVGESASSVLAEADEIGVGRVRLFGGTPETLELTPPCPQADWSKYALGRAKCDSPDIKLVWEPGRFGWAFTLARAFHLSGENRHARSFWALTEHFLDANPPYLGPHWESAQEAALRLVGLVFAYQVLQSSSETTRVRAAALARAIAHHAARLPPTLIYARSQNNNHLLAEAAGLLTASAALPGHPRSAGWRDLGWRWFNHGLLSQIAEDGVYIQHSANYHRLMLQIALWGTAAARALGLELTPVAREHLGAATRWALDLIDPASGRLPNLGPNDGGRLLPLAAVPFEDYRPTLAAAARVFLGESPFPPGPWDELGLWLDIAPDSKGDLQARGNRSAAQTVICNAASDSWGYLRVPRFTDRPGHADVLHFDLWWRGSNLAQDAGSYSYNAPPPWENSLARTGVHNTITVDGQDQMTRAGRFLWLDWPACEIIDEQRREDGRLVSLTARHDGYRHLGVFHQRRAVALPDGSWTIEDLLLPSSAKPAGHVHLARLHWLLQDLPWALEETGPGHRLRLETPRGEIYLTLSAPDDAAGARTRIQLVRSGELLSGSGSVDPTWGWASPTYSVKHPALSYALYAQGALPMRLKSVWGFENK